MRFHKVFYQFIVVPFLKLQYFHALIISRWLYSFNSKTFSVTNQSVMIFSPHQDDETLGCGGLICLKSQLNVSVKVVFITDGQKSHENTPWIKPPANLIQVRKQEAINALNILGVKASNVEFLDLIDGTLSSLTNEQRLDAVSKISKLMQRCQPKEVYVPHRHDNHPDHESTYKLVQAAINLSEMQVELWQYPIWIFWESPMFFKTKLQDLAGAYLLSIDSVVSQKEQALTQYKSQHPILPPRFIKSRFVPYEIYFKP